MIELLVVMVIISILLGFVLVAAMDAAHRAEERATQALVTKLEQGLNDRLEALIQNVPDPNYPHGYMAAIFYGDNAGGPLSIPPIVNSASDPNTALKQTLRAKVIAVHDFLKSELPDVFFVQSTTGPYPLNFAALPYPSVNSPAPANYILPLGNSVPGPYTSVNPSFGDGNVSNPMGTGIYGASYPIAAGLYKNLGYLPEGYDGVDNDNNTSSAGYGLVDDWSEGVNTTNRALVEGNLGRHTHGTARSEMLYAILVEGRGPLGSVFSRDDFTDREVQDTDNDGLPEFVDAWGQPLLFFRWPILFHSDLQRGQIIAETNKTTWKLELPYATSRPQIAMLEAREQDPLDPNQQLVAPAWWSQFGVGTNLTNYANSATPTGFGFNGPASELAASNGVVAFESYFHRLTEAVALRGLNGISTGQWDRGTNLHFYNRRAYYSKFLILSPGLDKLPGVFRYADADIPTILALPGGAQTLSTYLVANENNGMPFAMDVFNGDNNHYEGFSKTKPVVPFPSTFTSAKSSVDPTHPASYDLLQAGQDDISNHNIDTGGAIGGSG